MDNATADAVGYLAGYWGVMKWALLVIGVIFLIIAVPLRRPGKAFAVLLLGVYATGAWYFMTIYDSRLEMTIETAIAVVVVAGLVVLGIFYYFVFIRTET